MQIFIVGSIYETANILDKKRFHRQISEAKLVYNGLLGKNGWGNSMIALMYKKYVNWLDLYIKVFELVKNGRDLEAINLSNFSERLKPPFIIDNYILNMKRRLYTKDPIHYKVYAIYGTSMDNIYYINGQWRIYKQKE